MRSKLCLLNSVLIRSYKYINLRHFTCSHVVFNETNENIQNWKNELHDTMQIIPNFVTTEEENSLMQEIDPYMKRLRYEYSHWDNAIHGYRETERRQWNEENIKVINRIFEKAFPKGMRQLPLIHILDLAAEGWIKPHVDSIKFCGEIIAGLSLLTDSVMRLTMIENDKERCEDFLLPRKSLYIMSGAARYKYNHEILKNEESYYEGQHIPKNRRISVICRSEPKHNT